MDKNYWGFELRIDLGGCSLDKITSKENVAAFVKQLVQDIDMVAYGEPDIPNFGHGDKAGFSLNQWISTSNITGHFVNELLEVYLNIFSCKPFDKDIATELAIKYFEAKTVQTDFKVRKALAVDEIDCDCGC